MPRHLLPYTLLAALASPVAQACEFCLLSQGISPLQSVNGAGMRIAPRYTVLDEVYQGSRELPNTANVAERFFTTEFTGFYTVNEQLTLIGTLPMRSTDGDGDVETGATGGPDFATETGGAEGIGDVSLLARYTFLKHHSLAATTLVAASVGLKLPSGDTLGRTDAGDYMDAHTQLGTGSTDVLLGLSASHALGRINLSANVLAAVTTEGDAGHVSHQFGDSINYDVTAKYRLMPALPGDSPLQVFVSLGVNGEWRARETLAGLTVDDSGGQVLYITPGVQVVIDNKWIVEAGFQEAVHHDLNGIQLGERYRVSGGITYLF